MRNNTHSHYEGSKYARLLHIHIHLLNKIFDDNIAKNGSAKGAKYNVDHVYQH